jgi:hypothetical protein
MTQARKFRICSPQEGLDPLIIHHLGTVDLHLEHEAFGVYQQMTLTSLDLLAWAS